VAGADSTTVILAEDHELYRDGVRNLLEASELRVVAEAATAAEAVPLVAQLRPDVACAA
jgi:DNA-binding NarL/FixJ family response regulator